MGLTALYAGLALFGLIAPLVWWGTRRDDSPRGRIKYARTVTIAQARPGEVVKLVGRVRLGRKTVTGPLSGRVGACYRVAVTERNPEGGGTLLVLEEQEGEDFFLLEGSSRARVQLPQQPPPIVTLHGDFETTLDQPEVQALMARHGVEPRAGMVVREGVIEEGMTVGVLGIGRWAMDNEPTGYRDDPRFFDVTAPEEGMIVTNEAPLLGPKPLAGPTV